ncbi:hypothetical protein ACFWBV_17925 [Streptomyces sp. NPDC060030]
MTNWTRSTLFLTLCTTAVAATVAAHTAGTESTPVPRLAWQPTG